MNGERGMLNEESAGNRVRRSSLPIHSAFTIQHSPFSIKENTHVSWNHRT
jgi:hypothetical protein